MKAFFYVDYPLAWAKGGWTTQIMETKRSLENLDVEVNWLHHEDLSNPGGDILHYWSLPPSDSHWKMAKQRGMKIVISTLHQKAVLRPRLIWSLRGSIRPHVKKILGAGLYGNLGLDIYPNCDAAIAITPYEAEYIVKVLGSKEDRTFCVPDGVDPIFLDDPLVQSAFDGLTYVGYISERKNSLEVARAAKKANVRVKFIGGSTFENDPYFIEFQKEIDNELVFWEGEVKNRRQLASLIKSSKGLVLASQNEGLPIVILEALALGKPVMASDLPNLRRYFGDSILYCQQPSDRRFIHQLESFYRDPPEQVVPRALLLTWEDVAFRIKGVYERVLGYSDK